jgi:hypothetical protein
MYLIILYSAILIPFFSVTVQAWLPGNRTLLSQDGVDLFSRSSQHEAGVLTRRYLPRGYGNDKKAIRGVNLGSLFIIENWMADNIFAAWGCNDTSEFDCVSSLHDQEKANADFQTHWGSWITQQDFIVCRLRARYDRPLLTM